jgi:hypothetical protein
MDCDAVCGEQRLASRSGLLLASSCQPTETHSQLTVARSSAAAVDISLMLCFVLVQSVPCRLIPMKPETTIRARSCGIHLASRL